MIKRRNSDTDSLQPKKSLFSWRKTLSAILHRNKLDDAFWDDLEEAMILADVGVKTTTLILDFVKEKISKHPPKNSKETIIFVKEAIESIFKNDKKVHLFVEGKRLALMLVGVNGSGKTTTAAKLSNIALTEKRKISLVAADTFRTGAIEQLQKWGDYIGIQVISQQPRSDPGSVIYDALMSAKSNGTDTLIIDTAGRLHTRHNLMEELRKLRRILDRHSETFHCIVLLVFDGTTGQNGLVQARKFSDAVDCSGIVLTKMDGTAKGGIVLSITNELGLPILFTTTGEKIDDIVEFSPRQFADNLLSSVGD